MKRIFAKKEMSVPNLSRPSQLFPRYINHSNIILLHANLVRATIKVTFDKSEIRLFDNLILKNSERNAVKFLRWKLCEPKVSRTSYSL
jgi:hypothetical protein